jgi:hypothetical protein
MEFAEGRMCDRDFDMQHVEADVVKLHCTYGDNAAVYAQNRRAAAKLLGDDRRTRHWSDVVQRLQEGDDK